MTSGGPKLDRDYPIYSAVSALRYAMQRERYTQTGIARRAAFADALERLIPPSEGKIENVDGLRNGRTFCGSAACSAVMLGADPEVVVATARLILS